MNKSNPTSESAYSQSAEYCSEDEILLIKNDSSNSVSKSSKLKIAIIGSGISGLASAYFLNKDFDIKVYEKNNYVGGHSNTLEVDYNSREIKKFEHSRNYSNPEKIPSKDLLNSNVDSSKKIAVDTGFIVFNHQTYPNLKSFFELLKVDCKKSKMSFAVKINDGELEYAGTSLGGVFAQKKNLFDLSFWRMLRDIIHFNKNADQILKRSLDPSYNIKSFLGDLRVGKYFCDYYLFPMAAAIWSTPIDKIVDYPASSFVQFFKNHGLLTVTNQPQWYTVNEGSVQYVKKITDNFSDKISLNDKVKSVHKNTDEKSGKWVVVSEKSSETFDYVVIAAHSDQALQILDKPNQKQQEILSKIKYQKNLAVLHKDQNVMPRSKKAWASWVYSNIPDKQTIKTNLSVSYWMNNLQGIDDNYPLFVTLNPNQKINPEDIFAEIEYEHPVFDGEAIVAQSRISEIQGEENLYFCGAYQKYGFHEDGMVSALNVVNSFGIKAPWQS